jgi:transcriptional regulator with XRE-family HTH domain
VTFALRSPELMSALMKTWNLSSRGLAERAGCSKSLVHNLSSGTRGGTSVFAAARLAQELQVPLSTLFDVPTTSTISERNEALVNTAWVARNLGVSPEWVRNQATTGALPAVRAGRGLRFRPSEVQAFIQRRSGQQPTLREAV